MTLDNFWIYIIICLFLTIIIEAGLAFVLKYRKIDLIYIILVQIITNPIFNTTSLIVFFKYGPHIQKLYVYIMEVLILIVEGFIYYKTLERRKINPFLLSLILNGTSYILGLIIL